jgi:hypothetical protein
MRGNETGSNLDPLLAKAEPYLRPREVEEGGLAGLEVHGLALHNIPRHVLEHERCLAGAGRKIAVAVIVLRAYDAEPYDLAPSNSDKTEARRLRLRVERLRLRRNRKPKTQ